MPASRRIAAVPTEEIDCQSKCQHATDEQDDDQSDNSYNDNSEPELHLEQDLNVEDKAQFSASLQSNYNSIYTSQKVEMNDVLDNIATTSL